MTVAELARLLGGEVEGDGEREITGVGKLESAGPTELSFLANPKYARFLDTTRAGAVLVSPDEPRPDGGALPTFIRVRDPYSAFLELIARFNPTRGWSAGPGVHPTAVVGEETAVPADASVGAGVVLGRGVTLGKAVVIGPNTVVGDGAEIGDGTELQPNVTVFPGCRLGARVLIGSGTVIGSDGFGHAPQPDGSYRKIPQLGIVVVEDDVEIGANCTIDRATVGETRIGRGAKLDNLIQIAHNVTIGPNTVIAAQTGVSGSTKIGANCMIGGQVGIVGHIEIADGVKIGAQSGISKGISEAGATYFGYPAKPIGQSRRIEASLRNLPALLRRVDEIERRLRDQDGPAESS